YPAPRGAAQTISSSSHHRERDEGEDQDVRQDLARDDDLEVVAESRRCVHRGNRQTDEQNGLDEPEEKLLARSVIGETVTLEGSRDKNETASLGPAAERIEAEGRDRQQDVHDVDPEERPARAVEREPPRLPGEARGRRRRRRGWRDHDGCGRSSGGRRGRSGWLDTRGGGGGRGGGRRR